ncbi:hypothetical protein XU18_0342 [Perkinsela sp. CCAP 1560/4]|nr:hypothetical protein XU18_0342 [Perkinsela sp. CCAP 1560/4]|eukprot:KNH09657.1 hypothetical protein XU18_0342 [Perkinsela sp. CCAP 1560/4]
MSDTHVYTCIRVRPPLQRGEMTMRMDIDHSTGSLTTIKDINMMSKASRTSTETKYSVDQIFDESCATSDVFSEIWPLLRGKLFRGENANFSVYGQTGSGKTYTVDGVINSLLPSLFNEFYEFSTSLEVSISYVQIYCDSVYDLLDKNKLVVSSKAKFSEIESILKISVKTPEAVRAILKKTQRYKKQAAHALNKLSSRSHTILKVSLHFTKQDSNEVFTPSLYLVDLAGSERNSRTLTRGTHFEEGCQINKSLSCLAKCLECMAQKYALIPFRESVLTMFLRDALCRSGFILVCCIAPELCNESETRSTIKFATLARRIICQRQSSIDHIKRRTLRAQHEEEIQTKLADQKLQYEREIDLLKKRLVSSQMTATKQQQQAEEVRSRLALVKHHNSQQVTVMRSLKEKYTALQKTLECDPVLNFDNGPQDVKGQVSSVKTVESICEQVDRHYHDIELFHRDESFGRIFVGQEESDSRLGLLHTFWTAQPTTSFQPKIVLNIHQTPEVFSQMPHESDISDLSPIKAYQLDEMFRLHSSESNERIALYTEFLHASHNSLREYHKQATLMEAQTHKMSLKEQEIALRAERESLADETSQLHSRLQFTQDSLQHTTMEETCQKLLSAESLSRARIDAEEKSHWISVYENMVGVYTQQNESNRIISKETRRRSRIEAYALQLARNFQQKLSKQIIGELSIANEKAQERGEELYTTLETSQKRFVELLEDNKTLMKSLDHKENDHQTMVKSHTNREACWSLEQDEMVARMMIIFETISQQSQAIVSHFFPITEKYAISLDASGKLSYQAVAFWTQLVNTYFDSSIEFEGAVERLSSELEENSEIYARKSIECDDWHSEAMLWKTRCDSIAKVLHGKSIIDLPEVMEEGSSVLAGTGFERFLNSLTRLTPPRKSLRNGPATTTTSLRSPVEKKASNGKGSSPPQEPTRKSFPATSQSAKANPSNSNAGILTNRSPPVRSKPRSTTPIVFSTPIRTSPWKPKNGLFSPRRRGAPSIFSPYGIPMLPLNTMKRGNHSPSHTTRVPCKCSVCSPIKEKE